jgi:hypothetical protein
MCLEYITAPNAIILAVTASNTDITNSDALQLAQMADPAVCKPTVAFFINLNSFLLSGRTHRGRAYEIGPYG